MKRKGFTLIELLSIIVLLAIISLIIVPIAIDVISNTKVKSYKRSAELYIDAVRTTIVKENLYKDLNPSICEVQSSGNIKCDNEEEIQIKIKGKRPSEGHIYFEDGKIIDYKNLLFDGYYLRKGTKKTEISKYKTYKNGEVVYFDVDKGIECTNYIESQSNTGVKTGCMKFYVVGDKGEKSVFLLLDHNTTAAVAWNSNGSNATGPNELLRQLKTDTTNWKRTIEPPTYKYSHSTRSYTIDYTGYKARLITANEISKLTNNKNWNESASTKWYYFDTLNQTESDARKSGYTSGGKYGWLYDRTNPGCKEYGCLNNSDKSTWGYWTSSALVSGMGNGWAVDLAGYISNYDVSNNGRYGVRPVIEVLKSNIDRKVYENGEIVYFDVSEGKQCINYTTEQSNIGKKSGCMKFYVFGDEGEKSSTLNLILDHNTTAIVAWNSNISNEIGPKEIFNQLQIDTANWKGTIKPSNYEYKGSTITYTIDYKGYKARLITADEVAKITGNKSWNEITSNNWYYFQDLTQNDATGSGVVCASQGCKYGWLYDRTNPGCKEYGCLNNSDKSTWGYWTSSALVSGISNVMSNVWAVDLAGYISNFDASHNGRYGLRPVITISKSQI